MNDYTSYCCDKYPREPFQNDCCADTIQNPRFTLEKPTIINYTPPPNPTKTDGPGKSGYYGPLRDTTRSGYYRGGRETTRTVVPIGSLTSTTESGSTLALPTEVSSSATTSGNGTVTSATSSPISTGAASKIGSGIRPYQQIAVGVVAALGVQMFV